MTSTKRACSILEKAEKYPHIHHIAFEIYLLAAPSVLILIQPISGKYQKTCIEDQFFPVIVLIPNCFMIEKFEI